MFKFLFLVQNSSTFKLEQFLEFGHTQHQSAPDIVTSKQRSFRRKLITQFRSMSESDNIMLRIMVKSSVSEILLFVRFRKAILREVTLKILLSLIAQKFALEAEKSACPKTIFHMIKIAYTPMKKQ